MIDVNLLKKRILAIVVVLVLVAGSLLFGIIKLYLNWQALEQETALASATLQDLQNQLINLSKLKEQENLLQTHLQSLNEALPREINVEELTAMISDAAWGTGGDIKEISFEEVIAKNDYRELPFRVIFEGEFQGLLRFLQQLEEQPQVLRVDEMTLHSDRDSLIVRANLTVTAIYGGG